MFFAHAIDDPISCRNSLELFAKVQDRNILLNCIFLVAVDTASEHAIRNLLLPPGQNDGQMVNETAPAMMGAIRRSTKDDCNDA